MKIDCGVIRECWLWATPNRRDMEDFGCMKGQRLSDFEPMRRRCNGTVFGGGSLIPVVQRGSVAYYDSAGHGLRPSGYGASLERRC